MKKHITAILALAATMCLLLGACGPGTVPSMQIETFDEFKEIFGEVFIFPAYYPEGFDLDSPDVTIYSGGSFSNTGKKRQRQQGFWDNMRADDYYMASYGVWRETDKSVDYFLYMVSIGKWLDTSYNLPNRDQFSKINGSQYDSEIRIVNTAAYKTEDGESAVNHEEPHEVNFEISFLKPEKEYVFSFNYHFNPFDDETEYQQAVDLLRQYCIDEAMKMYESIK